MMSAELDPTQPTVWLMEGFIGEWVGCCNRRRRRRRGVGGVVERLHKWAGHAKRQGRQFLDTLSVN